MRILFYLSRFPGWGGIETVTEILGNKLVDLGYQVDLLTHSRQDRQSELLKRGTYYIMPDEGKWDTKKNREFAIDLVRKKRYSVIIYQDSYAKTDQIAIQMKKKGGRLIVCEHNMPTYNQNKSSEYLKGVSLPIKLYRSFFSLPKQIKEDGKRHLSLLCHSNAYVVLSDSYKDELLKVCKVKRLNDRFKNIYSINNPIASSTFSEDYLSLKENIVLFVGQINSQKRVDIMIDAWKQLIKRRSDWKFQIVGDGPLRDKLIMKVKNERVDRVEFCGFQQPKQFYQKASIFWMASSYEGWGMTLVEAMSEGCIPIGMNTYASIHDIIDDELNGFITPANNLDAFIEKTFFLMENNKTREKMANAASRKIMLFDAERIAKQWDDLIHHVINT